MNNNNIYKTSLVVAALGVFLSVSAEEADDEESSNTINEVIVTVQKRAESIQDVPISVNSFSGESLAALGIQNADDVMANVANAGTTSQGGGKTNYNIRGVGSNDFHANTVGAVGVYQDDVALNSPFAITFSTFDIDRIEVMRGPQNILFGRNTTGGAVNFVSRTPDLENETNGYLQATMGRFGQQDVEGAIGFLINDDLAARLSLSSRTSDGAFNNPVYGKTGGIDQQAARLQLLWSASEDLNILLNVHTGKSNDNPIPTMGVGLKDPNDPTLFCSVPESELFAQNNPFCADGGGFVHQYNKWEDDFSGMEHEENVDLWGTTLKIEWDLGSTLLTSISSVESYEVNYRLDSDASPNIVFHFFQDGIYDQYSQELRLQSQNEDDYRWTAGLYWFLEEADYATVVRRTPTSTSPNGNDAFNIIPNTIVHQDNEVYSIYGQYEYDLSEKLTATVGLRFTHEEKTGVNNSSVRCVGTGGPPFCAIVGPNDFFGLDEIPLLPALVVLPEEELDLSTDEWGLRLSLDWKATDDALIYGTFSRGFKAGGFSLAALQALTGNGSQSVDSEILWAYEAGVKSKWLDGTLQLNAAVFYYQWDNLQTFALGEDPADPMPRLRNVKEASLSGAEIELQWALGNNWLIISSLGLLDTKVEDRGDILGISEGNELTNSPDITFNGLVRKEIELDAGTIVLQATAAYKGDVFYELSNSVLGNEDGYWDIGSRVSYRFGLGEIYEIALWGKNLSGEQVCGSLGNLITLSDGVMCVPKVSEPTYGITATMRFE